MAIKRRLRSRSRTARRKRSRSTRGGKAVLSMRTSIKRKAKSASLPLSLSSPTKKALTKWINSKAETKYAFNYIHQCNRPDVELIDRRIGPTIARDARWIILPPVTTGNSVFTRVGKEIEPLRLKVKMTLSLITPSREVNWVANNAVPPPPEPYGDFNSGPEDITAHVYVFFSKLFPDWAQRNNDDWTMLHFLKHSNQANAAYGFEGVHENGKMVMNTEEFRPVHHFAIRLKKGAGYQSYVRMITTNPPEAGTRDPEDRLSAFTSASQFADLTFSVPLPKKLSYAAQANAYPEHYCPYLAVSWSSNEYPMERPCLDTVTPLAVTATTHLWYKDM